jgi:hypothetical protein
VWAFLVPTRNWVAKLLLIPNVSTFMETIIEMVPNRA